MNIRVNGEDRVTDAPTLAALWSAEAARFVPDGSGAPPRRGYAIALNGAVVRATRWDETELKDGDSVEIIRAVAGG